MALDLLIAHLEDLVSEAKSNPKFNLAGELISLAQAIDADEQEMAA